MVELSKGIPGLTTNSALHLAIHQYLTGTTLAVNNNIKNKKLTDKEKIINKYNNMTKEEWFNMDNRKKLAVLFSRDGGANLEWLMDGHTLFDALCSMLWKAYLNAKEYPFTERDEVVAACVVLVDEVPEDITEDMEEAAINLYWYVKGHIKGV